MEQPLLLIERDCEEAVRWASASLSRAGLQAVQTFDLHIARLDPVFCACPRHGSVGCDCQMVVLLVYPQDAASGQQPASLVAHGHNGQTWLMLVDSQQQNPCPGLTSAIRSALATGSPLPAGRPLPAGHPLPDKDLPDVQ